MSTTGAAKDAKYAAVLELKSRAGWSIRTFKLVGQSFDYYDEKDRLNGTISTAGCKAKALESKECDSKDFPFMIETEKGEIVYLNATSGDIREKCVEVLNYSSKSAIWEVLSDQARTKRDLKREEQRLKSYQNDAALLAEELASLRAKNARDAAWQQRNKASMKSNFLHAKEKNAMRAARFFALVILQAWWRGVLGRLRATKMRRDLFRFTPENSATMIQTRFRMRKARKIYNVLRAEQIKQRQQKALAKLENGRRNSLQSARYEVDLEVRASGRQRAWQLRNCVLVGQTFEYYEGEKLKGKVLMKGSTVTRVTTEEEEEHSKLFSDDFSGKPYGICVDTGRDKVLLNALTEESHIVTSDLLRNASKSANWSLTSGDKHESLVTRKERILREDSKLKQAARAKLLAQAVASGEDVESLKRRLLAEEEQDRSLPQYSEDLKRNDSETIKNAAGFGGFSSKYSGQVAATRSFSVTDKEKQKLAWNSKIKEVSEFFCCVYPSLIILSLSLGY